MDYLFDRRPLAKSLSWLNHPRESLLRKSPEHQGRSRRRTLDQSGAGSRPALRELSTNSTSFYRRRLPHWQPEGVPIFLTWRLYGSLPRGMSIHGSLTTEGKRFL